MKVAYIRPRMGDQKNREAMEPLGIAALHANSLPEFDYEFYDEMLEDIPNSLDADLIAIGFQTFSAARAYRIADHYRQKGQKVILGGPHPTLLPREAIQHADAIATGAGEFIWPRILHDFYKNSYKPVYTGGVDFGNNGYDRSIYKKYKYLPVHPVEFQRGCNWNCDFCSVPHIQPGEPICREAEHIVSEIKTLRRKNILFVDDNLLSSQAKLKNLLRAIKPLNIKWGCQISINIARSPELIEEMARCGCVVALIGFESIAEKNLSLMNKRSNQFSGSDYRAFVKKLQDAGIFVFGSFIFGYDQDNRDTLEQTLDFALSSKMFLANFNTLTPMPGTKLYERLKKEGRLIHPDWWLHSHIHYGDVMFHPIKMEADELKAECIRVRKSFYSTTSLLKRFPLQSLQKVELFKILLYISSNLVTGKSIYDKMKEITP